MPVPFQKTEDAFLKLADTLYEEMKVEKYDPNAPMIGLSKMLDDLCACGQESEYGAHWMENDEIQTAYWCSACRHNTKKFS